MGREWKPGDVAIVTTKRGHEYRAVYSLAPGIDYFWDAIDGDRPSSSLVDPDASARPLVVIDPENSDHLDGLCKTLVEAMWRAGDKASAANGVHPATVAAALREFANPTPPRPDEPTGLGAVVEDAEGNLWIRRGPTHYIAAEGSSSGFYNNAQTWSEIAAVRVLSEGVTNE